MADLPSGILTFLFTDVEGSTRMWERNPAAATEAMRRHDELIKSGVEAANGQVVRAKGEGDSFFAVFRRPADAVAAALQIQRSLAQVTWPGDAIVVRVALNTGEAEFRDGDYYGAAVNRCARLRAIAHGGQVLMGGTTESLARDFLPPNCSLIDLGEHRLRDVNRAERVFQLVHPDLRADFPPLKALDATMSNLPATLTTFVGRERELASVRALLESSRLVTLTGVGGSGKTRLAQQAASTVLDRFSDGTWWVDLAPLTDARQVEQALAMPLGVHEMPSRSLSDVVIAHLARLTTLIMLDNCEHLIAPVALIASRMLEAAPGLRILATSQEPLAISGERVVAVHELAEDEAVALFEDRARLANPAFAVTQENSQQVAAICRRLDFIPLAIELAAPRTKLMSLDQLEQRLGKRFSVLAGGNRTAPSRQQTLRATVDWSYELLDADEKGAFSALSVFIGGFTLEAAEAVCGPDRNALDMVSRLVDKSLLSAEQTESAPRYRMLETLREYAQEKLIGTELEAPARERHAAFYVELAERTNAKGSSALRGETLELELPNLRAALLSLRTAKARDQLRLATALASWWPIRGNIPEGRACMAAAIADAAADDSLLPFAFHELAWLTFYVTEYASAMVSFEKCIELAKAAGDKHLAARALNGRALCALSINNLAAARVSCMYALDEASAISDLVAIAQAYHYLGMVEFLSGNLAPAHEHLTKSVALRERNEDPGQVSLPLGMLAMTDAALGDLAAARAGLKRAFAIQRVAIDQVNLSTALISAGSIAASAAEWRAALVFKGACDSLMSASGFLPPLPLRDWVKHWAAQAEEGMGDGAAGAWAEGQRMTPYQAIDYGLAWLEGLDGVR